MKNYILFALLLSHVLLFSQNSEFGLLVGGSAYTGDIEVTARNFGPQTSPAVGIFARKHYSTKFAIRTLIAIGGLKGDEKNYPTSKERQLRGFSFKGTVAELALLPEWRPFRVGNVSFLAFAGVAAIYVNPKSNFNDGGSSSTNSVFAEDQNQKYPKIALSVPFGGGLQWYINETTGLGAELGFRKTFTDYLDGFSATANPLSTDYYLIGGVTFSKFFTLGNDSGGGRRSRFSRRGVNCPSFN